MLDYDTLQKQFDKMSGLTPEVRHWYTIQYASRLFHNGQVEDAEKLLDDLKDVNVTHLNNNTTLANILRQMGKTDAAEKLFLNFQQGQQGS